jgi:hypothetical protein
MYQKPKVFSPKRSQIPKLTALKTVEIVLILVVLVGTIAVFSSIGKTFKNISFGKIGNLFAPQVPVETNTQEDTTGNLKKKLENESISVKEIKQLSSGDFVVVTQNEIILEISGEKDLDIQVRALQNILAKAKIEERGIKRIDFRFEKVIVEYK